MNRDLKPPGGPSFREWFDAQQMQVWNYLCVRLRFFDFKYRLGDDYEGLVSEVWERCHRYFEFRDLQAWERQWLAFCFRAARQVGSGMAIRGKHDDINDPHFDEAKVDRALSHHHRPRDPLGAAAGGELAARIAAVIRAMKPGRPRDWVVLRARGWSNEQIVEFLYVNLETVNSTWTARGREDFEATWRRLYGNDDWNDAFGRFLTDE